MKYSDWLQGWLSTGTITFKNATRDKYEQIIRCHVAPSLGEREINDITAADLRDFSIRLISAGLASNTIKGILYVVKSSLQSALKNGVLGRDCTQAIIVPKHHEKPVSALSIKEQKAVEQFVLSHQRPEEFGIVFTLYTGVRIGELLALQWKDIDLVNGTVYIHKTSHDTWQNCVYQKHLDPPKTISSNRNIPIPKQIIPFLKKLYYGDKEAFLVENTHHHCLQTRSYQEMFSKILQKLNIAHKGFHSLRHTFATRALECGMDIKTLSEILGHANPNITLSRYAHSMLEHKTHMMNRIGGMLSIKVNN